MDQNINLVQEHYKIEKLLKGNEVARLLNVSRSFAYMLMQSGELPTVRLGRSVRVKPSDLEKFIHKNTVDKTIGTHWHD